MPRTQNKRCPVRLIHWSAAEAAERVRELTGAGFNASWKPLDGMPALRELRDAPLGVVLIDLSRSPMRGRNIAIALRFYKKSRDVPIVFVEGVSPEIDRVKEAVPDAIYTDWRNISAAIRRAITDPPKVEKVPASMLAGYSGTPLPKKLGIKTDFVVALVGAPDDFERTLGNLPNGVTLKSQVSTRTDLILWFTKTCKELQQKIAAMAKRCPPGGLWIIWPKKTSALASDVSETEVRKVGLASGLVDYKVCAVDATWSGLKFARRKRS